SDPSADPRHLNDDLAYPRQGSHAVGQDRGHQELAGELIGCAAFPGDRPIRELTMAAEHATLSSRHHDGAPLAVRRPAALEASSAEPFDDVPDHPAPGVGLAGERREAMLSAPTRALRMQALRRLQQELGNAYVQRLVAGFER